MSIRVQRTPIIGTKVVVFSAWEPSALCGNHSTITTIDEVWYGRIGSRRLTPELNALPAMSDERYNAVKAWHAAQYEEAYAAIVAAHPEAAGGIRDMGEIRITTE